MAELIDLSGFDYPIDLQPQGIDVLCVAVLDRESFAPSHYEVRIRTLDQSEGYLSKVFIRSSDAKYVFQGEPLVHPIAQILDECTASNEKIAYEIASYNALSSLKAVIRQPNVEMQTFAEIDSDFAEKLEALADPSSPWGEAATMYLEPELGLFPD
jgi:hypothetical protein